MRDGVPDHPHLVERRARRRLAFGESPFMIGHQFPADTVDASSTYVAISRARTGAAVYTDSCAGLTEMPGLRNGP